MSDEESLLGDLFQYRFSEGGELQGHSFGNLFIVAMSQICDSFETALAESSKVLAGYGQVIPATMANLKLKAQFLDGTVVEGESNIRTYRGEIDKISIDPIDALAHPSAIQAIERADLIVVGPGSLYTSIFPKFLVPKII